MNPLILAIFLVRILGEFIPCPESKRQLQIRQVNAGLKFWSLDGSLSIFSTVMNWDQI